LKESRFNLNMTNDLSEKVFECLESVKDKETFIAFVSALAEEREAAEKIERENSDKYRWGGAMNWQNQDISSFLFAGLECFEDKPLSPAISDEPTWKGFAKFLYFGKIYE
jgi:hypothetical protein